MKETKIWSGTLSMQPVWRQLYKEHAVDRSLSKLVPSPVPASRFQHVHRWVKEIEPWGILAAVVGLFLAVATFWVDYTDRVEERTVRAWQLLTTKAPGNSGKIQALEYLNSEDGWCIPGVCKERERLIGIDLSVEEGEAGAFLYGVDLRSARLLEADLSRGNLRFGDLSGARLIKANLSKAYLYRTNLSGANLGGADLSKADLRGANLRDSDVDQGQLNGACGDEKTKLTKGLTIPMCSDGDWYEAIHGPR